MSGKKEARTRKIDRVKSPARRQILVAVSILLSLIPKGVTLAQSCTSVGQPDSDCDGIPNAIELGEGRNPTVKDNDIFNIPRLFVMQQYRDLFDREGLPSEVNHWTGQITTGTVSRAGLIDNFIRTTEFQNSTGGLIRLYSAYFLRRPDYGGLQFWLSRFRSGQTLQSISDSFAASQEFNDRYGN